MTALSGGPVWAEVVTDGTMGRRGVVRGGLDVTVRAGLGQLRGTNLFHSFERFGIAEGGKVTFTGPDRVTNVIARVTGGERSDILGTLASTMPGADFFLINPAGILFGPNAKLDLKGSFHASTADQLRLADGAVFSALDTAGSTLSVAEPQSFGFLGAAAGRITLDRGTLAVAPGERLGLSAGEITLVGGALLAGDQVLDDGIAAPGGRIDLVGLAGGELDLASGATSGGAGGVVSLTAQARVDASGLGGGSIRIRAEDIELREQSQILAGNRGDLDALAGIDIAGGRLTLAGGSLISADALTGTGRAGQVAVRTQGLYISDNGGITSNTFSLGDAGAVYVGTGRLMIDNGGANNVRGLDSSALAGEGNAGSVTVRADYLQLRAGGRIRSSTEALGAAGSIDVHAGVLMIDLAGSRDNTGIFSAAKAGSSGAGGMIKVEAGRIGIYRGGLISGSTSAAGTGSPLEVRAETIVADGGNLIRQTGIASDAREGTGSGGSIFVSAGDVSLLNNASITSSTLEKSTGRRRQVGDQCRQQAAHRSRKSDLPTRSGEAVARQARYG